MKKAILTLLAVAALLPACKKNSDSVKIVEGIVTVKGEKGEECTLQLDDKTVLVPQNISTNPYNRQVRARILYGDKGTTDRNEQDTEYRKVEVYRLDSILTKKPVPTLGAEQNDKVYGTAPIGIYDTWATVVEDGYITIHFTGLWGAYPILEKHTVNLVSGTDASDPLFFEFRHNYNDDKLAPTGYYRNGLVAFDVNDILGKINSNSFDITIKFIGFSTDDKRIRFHYDRGTSAHITESNGSASISGDSAIQ